MTPIGRRRHGGMVRVALLSLGVLMLAAPCVADDEPTSIGSAPYIAVVAASVADAYTTVLGLQTPHVSEGNPVLGSRLATILPLKTALTMVELYEVRVLAKSGHTRIARIVGFSTALVFSGLAMRNAHVVAQARGR